MTLEDLLPILTVAGSLLLVVTGLLNFSVFVRQLRAARDQLEMARQQMESAQMQPEIQLIQRAMIETNEHVKLLVEKPYLRPYFYDGKSWSEADGVNHDEVMAMAELMLNNFASAIIHSGAFIQYPVRSVVPAIRFHLRQSPAMRNYLLERFDHFQLAGLALLCLKNDTKTGAEDDLRHLINAAGHDTREKTRREQLLQYLQNTDKVEPRELAKDVLRHAIQLQKEA